MSFFKSNTTTTTNATTNEANQETGNNNGGLLKGLAIGIGTVAGIGAAYFGHKVYKSHHVVADENNLEDANVDDDVTDDETPAENAEDTTNETTVESFNEVETNVTENNAPVVEAEEAETEETKNPTPAETKVKAEETKDSETAKAEEAKADVTKNVAPAKAEATKETPNMRFERLLGEAVSGIPYDKPESVDLAFYIRCIGGYLHEINMDEAGNTGRFVIAEQCLAMTDLVSRAIIHIGSTNISDLDEYRGVYGDIKRLQLEFKASKIMDFTQKPELCKEKFEETLNMVSQNLKLTKEILKMKEVKPAASKTSAGETQTVDKAEGETKTSANESPSETQIGNSTVVSDDGETVTPTASVSQESIDNVNEVINIVSKIPNRENPELNDMAYFIRVIGGRIHGIKEPEATFIAYDEASNSNKFIDTCTDVCTLVGKAICNLANSGKNPLTSMQWIDRCTNELVASGIIDNTYNPNKYRSAILKAHNEAMDKLSKLVSNENQVDTDKVTGETNTVTNDKLIDEINTYVHAINVMAFKDFTMISTDSFVEKLHKIDECISLLNNSEPSKAIKRNAYKNINITVRLFCKSKLEDIDACASRIDIVDLCADVRAMLSLNLTNVDINETTLNAINNAITSAQNKADEIAAKYETKDLAKASDETQADASSSNENQVEEPLTYTMSEKIQEAVAVQQSDETAATTAPESKKEVQMSPEALELMSKLQEAGKLITAEKWSEAAEFYKTQLTPYLADNAVTDELRDAIMSIKTKATNMLMSQKQLEAKQKAAAAKASKKKSSRRRRH